MEVLIPIIAVSGFFAAVITFIYMKYKSQHQQRMALIDSGQNADIFSEKKLDNKDNALKSGMFLTGAGLGFLFGIILEKAMFLGLDEGLIFLPLTFVGGGIGLVLFYKMLTEREERRID